MVQEFLKHHLKCNKPFYYTFAISFTCCYSYCSSIFSFFRISIQVKIPGRQVLQAAWWAWHNPASGTRPGKSKSTDRPMPSGKRAEQPHQSPGKGRHNDDSQTPNMPTSRSRQSSPAHRANGREGQRSQRDL